MSATVWSEPGDAHPSLGRATMNADDLSDLSTPTPTPAGHVEANYLSPPPSGSILRIRVYDYCPEHGPHTDPQIEHRSKSYF